MEPPHNRDTVSGDNTGTVSGDNRGTLSGDNRGTVSGDNRGTVSGDNKGTVSGDNRGTVSGDNQILSFRSWIIFGPQKASNSIQQMIHSGHFLARSGPPPFRDPLSSNSCM